MISKSVKNSIYLKNDKINLNYRNKNLYEKESSN
jgi:hypothetical protein